MSNFSVGRSWVTFIFSFCFFVFNNISTVNIYYFRSVENAMNAILKNSPFGFLQLGLCIWSLH